MNVGTIEGWETTQTSTDDATFYTGDEPRRVYGDISSSDTFDSNEPRNVSVASSPSSTPPPPRIHKRKLGMGMSFPKKRRVSQHTYEACGRPLMPKRHPNAQEKHTIHNFNQTLSIIMTCVFKRCAHIRTRI